MHYCEMICVKNQEANSTIRAILTKLFSRLVISFAGLVLSHHYMTVQHVACCYNCFLPYCNEFHVGRDDIMEIIIAVCG